MQRAANFQKNLKKNLIVSLLEVEEKTQGISYINLNPKLLTLTIAFSYKIDQ